ncbi:MAG: DUF6165 family protein [Myxococcota bacterium]
MTRLRVDAAVGDVLDRITILRIKLDRVAGDVARDNVARELDGLLAAWAAARLPAPEQVPEYGALADANLALWEVEDALRAHEARGEFDGAFVARARSVYLTNDRRAALKRAVNQRYGSAIREEKVHPRYGDPR